MISSFVRLCVLLISVLSVSWAAQPAPPAENLKIIVVEGEGGINNIRQHTTQTPSVRVEDENQHPVPGAVVVFALPADGPSGVFQG